MAGNFDTQVPESWPATLDLGDHLALDFINTVVQSNESLVDHFASDADVWKWLGKMVTSPSATNACQPTTQHQGELRTHAIELREASRGLIERRKEDKRADPRVLNRILARGLGHHELIWSVADAPQLVRRPPVGTFSDVLLPVAESVADLIAYGDFKLVRKCENPACSLWFYDRTKSHRRRWCSTALCGNRMKVAAFRERQRTQTQTKRK